MNFKNNKLIICVIVLLIVSYVILNNNESIEGFSGVRYCGECGYRSRRKCGSCLDCGFCITSEGYGECVSGDENGPYFRSDCAIWEYGLPYHPSPYPDFYNILRYPWGWWYNRDRYNDKKYRRNKRRRRRRRNQIKNEPSIPVIEDTGLNFPKKKYRWTISDSGVRTRSFPKKVTNKKNKK
ncbi:MAG: hypothetical protein CMF62_04085 [Magnetococcales bacterium]|nr:hypothetical protein [Magnetococcales bacterium]|tara:strand:- start:12499 stop:13041 length:543 start_codon:yes stop_codon:yes gene_type:complete